MAKPLIASSIAAPAFFGLNTQESGVTLQDGFALKADNSVIDKQGRLSARKGWETISESLDGTAGGNQDINLIGMTNFIDITGLATQINWSKTAFYKGTKDLTTITPVTTDTLADGNWQSATLNDHQYFYQRGYIPLIYTNEGGSEAFESYAAHTHASEGYPSANTVLAAYGRLWAADTTANKTTVYFTDVLDGHKFEGGTAGTLDISSVLTQGMDEIVALGAHNGFLIIFCKNNIIVYGDNDNFQGAINTTALTLVEVIEGVGCIARDSVQNTGGDILFLSNAGVRSLSRTIQEKSQPMRDVSKNVRDDVILALQLENLNNVKSVYAPSDSFYLLTLPATVQTFCFDTRTQLEDGSFRVTLWNSSPPKGYLTIGTKLFYAQVDGVATYSSNLDNGLPYQMQYASNYFDLGMTDVNKIVKRVSATTVGITGQTFALQVGYDYEPAVFSQTFILDASAKKSEFDVSEFNLASYAGGVLVNDIAAPAQGSGNILQIGFTAQINGNPVSLQRLTIYAKQGKVL
tara:strand:- start:454 stop:2013 length:1560 start_codon:yes stop_codon:yes gene_type:complete